MRLIRKKASYHQDHDEKLRSGATIQVGRFTYGTSNLSLHAANEARLHIGRYCCLAAHIDVFLGGNHRPDWITTFPFGHIYQDELGGREIVGHPTTRGDVKIGNDVWIGQGSMIMSGVKIGDGAVIAARSHVVKDVPPYAMVGGNPARLIRMRFDEAIVERLLRLRWWEFSTAEVRKLAAALSVAPTVEMLDDLLNQAAGLPRDPCPWAAGTQSANK